MSNNILTNNIQDNFSLAISQSQTSTTLKADIELEKSKNALLNEKVYGSVVLPETAKELKNIAQSIEKIQKEIDALTETKEGIQEKTNFGDSGSMFLEDSFNKIESIINKKNMLLLKFQEQKEKIISRLASANSNATSNLNIFVPGQTHSSPQIIPNSDESPLNAIIDLDVFDS